jgi:Fe-S cluster assembly protein SufD
MVDLTTRPSSLIENHSLVRELLRTHGPEPLVEIRDRAFQKFRDLGVPTTRDEEFKYISLRTLEDSRFAPAYGATLDRQQLAAAPLGTLDATTLTFLNGEFSPELSSDEALPDGLFVGSLHEGFSVYPDLVLQHLGSIATLNGRLGSSNDERFVYLNTAYLGEGAFVYAQRGVVAARPIHIQWVAVADHGLFVAHPRTLVVLEDGAQVKLVESYSGLKGTYFTNAVTEAWIGPGAILEATKFQQEAPESIHIATVAVHQEAGSTLTSNNVNFGGRVVRNDVNVWLNGEHTETWLNGASVGLGTQVVDNHTRIDHAKPNCHSFETYKAILGGRATGVFNGKIFVYEDAQKTDAKQTNQAILLSPTATINTKPQLEIFADDVKCTHGATVGRLREDALFYLRSRGIPQRHAEALLVFAFAAEVIEKITVDGAREALERVLFQRLRSEEGSGLEE